MEGAFTHLGNHLVSDSAAAIKAGGSDELSNIDPDESLLFGGVYGGRGPRGGIGNARRRQDDDDNETEVFDDDDEESLASVPVDGMKGIKLNAPEEEEKELPAHACAYVPVSSTRKRSPADTRCTDTAAFTIPPALSSAWPVASGSAVRVVISPRRTSSTTSSARATRKFNCTPNPPLATPFSSATTVEPRMYSCLDSSLPSLTRSLCSCAASLAPQTLHQKT